MYLVQSIQVGKKHKLYSYCAGAASAANNMSNAALFRLRQVLTATDKDETDWTDNERGVMEEIRDAIPKMKRQYAMPTKERPQMSAEFLLALMVVTKNTDYYDKRISSQTAQHAIIQVVQDMDNFYASSAEYRENPSKYTAPPSLPHYRKSGGMCTAFLTNQDCYLEWDREGMCLLKLPYTRQRAAIGRNIRGTLKQVNIIPNHGVFDISVTMEVPDNLLKPGAVPAHRRIFSIDVGVENLASVINNIGERSFIVKGGVIKSTNQWYNKMMAKIQSEQTRGGSEKFRMTPEAHKLCLDRDNIIDDFMHKSAKLIVTRAVNMDIDTIIYGRNTGWKQNVRMGKKGNQKFVDIPFDRFRQMLSYLCQMNGICFLEQEESYTSKADFSAHDDMPVYGAKGAYDVKFSGNRTARGEYRTSTGDTINADLNAAANIGRKCIPDMFDSGFYPDFKDVEIINHPDQEHTAKLKEKQETARQKGPSKSKIKRMRRKGTY